MPDPFDRDRLAEWIGNDLAARRRGADPRPFSTVTGTRQPAEAAPALTLDSVLEAAERLMVSRPPEPEFWCSIHASAEPVAAKVPSDAVRQMPGDISGLPGRDSVVEVIFCRPSHMMWMMSQGAGFRLDRQLSSSAAVYRFAGGFGLPAPRPPLPPFAESPVEPPPPAEE